MVGGISDGGGGRVGRVEVQRGVLEVGWLVACRCWLGDGMGWGLVYIGYRLVAFSFHLFRSF